MSYYANAAYIIVYLMFTLL